MDWQPFGLTFVLFVTACGVQANSRCVVNDDTNKVCIHGGRLIRELERYVNKEHHASYKYQHMAQFYTRADQAYHGFASLFKKQSERAAENAHKLKEYFNKRATEIKFYNIQEPQTTTYHNLSYSVNEVLKHERFLNEELLKIHKAADQDPHLQYFIEEQFLDQKVEMIKNMADLQSMLNRLNGNHVGQHVLDERLAGGFLS